VHQDNHGPAEADALQTEDQLRGEQTRGFELFAV
jgi:hypothetical protein